MSHCPFPLCIPWFRRVKQDLENYTISWMQRLRPPLPSGGSQVNRNYRLKEQTSASGSSITARVFSCSAINQLLWEGANKAYCYATATRYRHLQPLTLATSARFRSFERGCIEGCGNLNWQDPQTFPTRHQGGISTGGHLKANNNDDNSRPAQAHHEVGCLNWTTDM